MPQDAESTAKIAETNPKPFSYAKLVTFIGIAIIVAVIFLIVAIFFGFLIIISIDAAKALVDSIATILGFFGLIAVYLLTSYDSRIDRLEEKIQDSYDETKIQRFKTIQLNIKTRKEYATIRIITGLCCLFVSLLLSIATLGILGVNPENTTQTAYQLAFLITILASMLLFMGVLDILIMIYSVGKEPN